MMQEVTSVLGLVPRNPFQTGKFFQDLSEFVGHNPEVSQLVLVSNLMRKLHNSRNYAFASFLVGLLQYNPSKRLTPCQAGMHPFLAPDFPCAYLLPQEGDTISDAAAAYTNILIPPEQYISKPHIDEEIKRRHFSGTELLKRGTTTVPFRSNKISSPPLLTKHERENISKDCSLAERVNSTNAVIIVDEKSNKSDLLPVENCRYAMDGPFTTSKPAPAYPQSKSLLLKEKIRTGGKEMKEKVTSISIRSALSTDKNSACGNQNNNNCFKLVSLDSLFQVGRSPSARFVRNLLEDHLLWWNCRNVVNSNGVSDGSFNQTTTSTKRKFYSEMCSSFDESNSAARTRVYNRNTKFRKLEQQNDLFSEIKCGKLLDPAAGRREEEESKSGYREHSPLVKSSVDDHGFISRQRRKKVPVYHKLFLSMYIHIQEFLLLRANDHDMVSTCQ